MTETTTLLSEAFDTPNEKGSSDPIPAGQYVASIFEASVGPLKSGKGQAVSLVWEVEGGEYSGRRIFDRVIIAHESAEAMRIGRAKFKDIATACGVTDAIKDLSVICNKPALVTVKIEEDKTGEYPDKNRVTRVKKITEAKKPNGGGGDMNDGINF
jgi:Protein of unknown function (DUF669)